MNPLEELVNAAKKLSSGDGGWATLDCAVRAIERAEVEMRWEVQYEVLLSGIWRYAGDFSTLESARGELTVSWFSDKKNTRIVQITTIRSVIE